MITHLTIWFHMRQYLLISISEDFIRVNLKHQLNPNNSLEIFVFQSYIFLVSRFYLKKKNKVQAFKS